MPRSSATHRSSQPAKRFEGGDLRQQVLNVARDLFAKEGHDRVSMRRIGSRVGCSPMAMYRYFAGKEELLLSVCEEVFARLTQRRDAAVAREVTPVARLRAAIRAFVEFGIEHPNHYKLAFMTDFPSRPLAARKSAIIAGGREGLGEIVQECIAAKKLELDAETTLQTISFVSHGMVAASISTKWKDSRQLIERVIRLLTKDFE